MRKVLGIEDFFYVADRSYDRSAENALPHYHEAHRLLVACLNLPADRPTRVIDLGVGSGVTSAYVLQNFPQARVTSVDLFPEMLEEAAARLKPFGDRVSLVRGDNIEFLRANREPVDAVVSAYCIHHQDEQAKKTLFAAIHDRLAPGGMFLMLDWTVFRTPHLQKVAREHTLRHLETNVPDPEYRRQWAHHWEFINIPSPADEMVVWMREAGLMAEVVFRDLEVALVGAVRS